MAPRAGRRSPAAPTTSRPTSSSPADRARLAEAVAERYGAVNALVNNAGRAPRVRADILEASEESFEELLRINLQGPYFLTQALARQMAARKQADPSFTASIVFVTSVSAEMASTARGEYCVSKAGLAMAARLFAVRLAPLGIPVFEVRPGIIATDMTAGVRETYDAQDRERPRSRAALGTTRGRRPRRRGAAARRHALRDRHGPARRRWADDPDAVARPGLVRR